MVPWSTGLHVTRTGGNVVLLFFRTHGREQNDVAYGFRAGQQHREPVDTDTKTGGRRHAVFQRFDIVFVEGHGFVVAAGTESGLLNEALFLIDRIVEFGEGVGDLLSVDVQLEALDQARFGAMLLGQR